MKCYCKYCLPRFYCQTSNDGDLCYYRYPLKLNTTDDFGCVQANVIPFLCNKTDANYRTECCSSFFCNMQYRLSNEPTVTSSNTHVISTVKPIKLPHTRMNVFNTVIILGTLVALLILALVIYYLCKRKFCYLWSSSHKSMTVDEDSIDLNEKKKPSLDFTISDRADTLSWNSNSSHTHNQMVLLETRHVNKQIRFFGQLGQGRHARVRLGLIDQQYRAIKMFDTRYQNEFERERIIFETVLIQHPNILAFFGADFFAKNTETFHVIITEWHPHGSLYDILHENKHQQRLSIEQMLQYAMSICDGLAHLHSIKYGTHDVCKPQMAHCDIKSSNILVKLNGDCCLADFSLAVRCDPHTQEIVGGGIDRLRHRVGTKLYMPPELLEIDSKFNFDRISAYQQGDMYSLALVLWEIGFCCGTTTHQRPYECQLPINFTLEHLIQLVCIEQKRPISNLNDEQKILVAYFDLLDFYWCHDPCARHSAANLQDQLRQFRPTTKIFLE